MTLNIHQAGETLKNEPFAIFMDPRRIKHGNRKGFETDRHEDVTHFIIDDPFGNFRTDYQDQRGNNIRITMDEFVVIFKPTGNDEVKWAHLIFMHFY